MKRTIHFLVFALLTISAAAQNVNQHIQSGNDYYKKEQYEEAEGEYRKALAIDPANTIAQFNLGAALYKKKKAAEAGNVFDELAAKEQEAELKGKSYYNKGVILTKQKALEESIEAYKNALRQNPDDKEARENLQKALLELKKSSSQSQDQKKQPQSKLNKNQVEQKLRQLQQKEKEIQERMQKRSGGAQEKDW